MRSLSQNQLSNMQHSRSDQNPELYFEVACSKQEVMGKLQKILKQLNYVPIVDVSGKIKVIVNGENPYLACSLIDKIVQSHAAKNKEKIDLDEPLILKIIDDLLFGMRIPKNTNGYLYLKQALFFAATSGKPIKPISKTLYLDVAKVFDIDEKSVGRCIRYATSSVGINISNLKFIMMMLDEIDSVYSVMKDRQEDESTMLIAESDMPNYHE